MLGQISKLDLLAGFILGGAMSFIRKRYPETLDC